MITAASLAAFRRPHPTTVQVTGRMNISIRRRWRTKSLATVIDTARTLTSSTRCALKTFQLSHWVVIPNQLVHSPPKELAEVQMLARCQLKVQEEKSIKFILDPTPHQRDSWETARVTIEESRSERHLEQREPDNDSRWSHHRTNRTWQKCNRCNRYSRIMNKIKCKWNKNRCQKRNRNNKTSLRWLISNNKRSSSRIKKRIWLALERNRKMETRRRNNNELNRKAPE